MKQNFELASAIKTVTMHVRPTDELEVELHTSNFFYTTKNDD